MRHPYMLRMAGDKVQQVATHLASIDRAACIENLYVMSRATALQVPPPSRPRLGASVGKAMTFA